VTQSSKLIFPFPGRLEKRRHYGYPRTESESGYFKLYFDFVKQLPRLICHYPDRLTNANFNKHPDSGLAELNSVKPASIVIILIFIMIVTYDLEVIGSVYIRPQSLRLNPILINV